MADSNAANPSYLPDIALSPTVEGAENPVIHALLRSTDYGVLMTDHLGTDVLCNPRFGELFDLDPQVVVHSSREDVRKLALARVKDPDDFAVLLDRIYQDPLLEHEDDIEVNSDPPRILRRYTGPVIDAGGGNLGRLWTFLDVTETRRVEAAKLRAVGALAASIAHDIRNILTPLKLEMEAGSDSAALAAHLDRLSALTHRLLALSSPASLNMQPVDLAALIERDLQLIRAQIEVYGIRVKLQASDKLPPVNGDPARLDHLFINLFLNAVNAMAANGGILTIKLETNSDMVLVEVRDTGCGIPQESMQRIFEPFYTTRANGMGLGLFSVKTIVEEHDGNISVDSKPGKGARFRIGLPACKEAA